MSLQLVRASPLSHLEELSLRGVEKKTTFLHCHETWSCKMQWQVLSPWHIGPFVSSTTALATGWQRQEDERTIALKEMPRPRPLPLCFRIRP